jgi:hypothetical protein
MKNFIQSVILGLFLIFTDQAIACTTFIISGKNTADGKPLLFKNRDTQEMSNALVLFNDGKYEYMGLVDGNEKKWNRSVWGGYNEKGFAIINSAAYNNNIGDTTKISDREGIIMKKALMVCASLEDFENFLDTLSRPLGVDSNFGVIDAYGGAAYYETGNYKYVKVDANNPEVAPHGIIIRTNHSMSSDLSKGFGFNRFENATRLLNMAWSENNLTPEHLFQIVPRSLYHSRTKTDLSVNIPAKRDVADFRFFIDYIPRVSTSSSFMIVGAKDEKHVKDAMMWTILGFPLVSVAVPAWLSSGELPKAAAMQSDYTAPICNTALKFKDECFPIKIDKGENYINLSPVLNKEGNGYLQVLQLIEKKIFDKVNLLISELDKKYSKKDIHEFYAWLDDYLAKSYKEQFNVGLFEN